MSKNNDLNRDIKFELDWAAESPIPIDYWDYSPPGIVGDEPVYYFGAANYFGVDAYASSIEQPPLADRRTGPITVEYDSPFFPGVGIFNPDVGDLDINTYNAGVRVFDQNEEVKIAFLRENRRTQELTMPNWLVGVENLVNNHFNTAFTKLEAILPIPLDIDASIETTANWTTFLTEHDNSYAYVENKEESIGGSFGFNGNVTWDLTPGPWITIGPYVNVGVSVGLAYEYAEKRVHNEPIFTPDGHTVEMPFTGEIALGAIVALNLHDQDTTGISFVVDVNGAFPVELKPKLQQNIQLGASCFIVEANLGPASLNISVNVGAQFNWGDLDVDLDVFNYNWSYPITDKYFSDPYKYPFDGDIWDCN